MPSAKDVALCIGVWEWSETSQTVALFTRAHGLMRGLAKGARREHGPFSGGFELLTRGEVVAILKPPGPLSSGDASAPLTTLTAWDLQESFPALRRSLLAFHAGMYVADLLRTGVHDSDPHPRLYDQALRALRALGDDDAILLALVRFQWWTLHELGYRPTLGDAASQGSGPLLFSPSLGGVVPEGTEGWRVRRSTIELLRAIEHAADREACTEPADSPNARAADAQRTPGLSDGSEASEGSSDAPSDAESRSSAPATPETELRALRLLHEHYRYSTGSDPRTFAALIAAAGHALRSHWPAAGAPTSEA